MPFCVLSALYTVIKTLFLLGYREQKTKNSLFCINFRFNHILLTRIRVPVMWYVYMINAYPQAMGCGRY